MAKVVIYLASPYGFTDAGREFMQKIMIPTIKKNKSIIIINPWEHFHKLSDQFKKIISLKNISKQKKGLQSINKRIAQINEGLIKQASAVVAVLDGADVDSGVASEIGFAYANKKIIIGYRSDFRLSGDNLGSIVNLQVEYFINKSGGEIVTNMSDLQKKLKMLIIKK